MVRTHKWNKILKSWPLSLVCVGVHVHAYVVFTATNNLYKIKVKAIHEKSHLKIYLEQQLTKIECVDGKNKIVYFSLIW